MGRNENPGALAGAAGANGKSSKRDDAAGCDRVQGRGMSVDRKPERSSFDTERDSFLLEVSANRKLSAAAKSVAIEIAIGHASRKRFNKGDRWIAWPSFETLAGATCYGRNAIIQAVKELEVEGHLAVLRHKGGGSGRSNRYRPLVKGTRNSIVEDTIEGDPNGIVEDTVSDGNGIVEDTERVSCRIPEPLKEPLDGAGAHAPAPEPPKTAPSPATVESSNDVSDASASAGARGRARSDDVQGEDHHASDPEAASFDLDLVPEHAPADGVVPLPIPRRGQHISLAERDALAEGWLRAEGPLADEADDEDAEAEEQDDREYAAVIQAAAELRRLHGWSTGDAETLVFEAVRGCVYGARESAQLAGDMACRAMSGLQDEAAAQAWRRHLAVMRAVFVVHAGDKKAEAVVARYARRYEAAKGMAAQVQAEAGKEVSHG